MLATAGFVVYAVQFSDFGKGGTSTVRIEGAPPPQGSPITIGLADAIGRASLGRRFRGIDMAQVAPFGWDRVYVFRDTTGEEMQKRLGFDWPGAPPAVPRSGERESLIAFVDAGHVAESAFFSDAVGHLECLTAERGYPRGTRFVVRYTPQGHVPYLATAPPDLAQRACLRAVGA